MQIFIFKVFFFLLLLLQFLSACGDTLLLSLKDDPRPEININDGNYTYKNTGKFCHECTVAQFDIDRGRVPFPSDDILQIVNIQLAATGVKPINGLPKNVPIRIPFDGTIKHTFDNKWPQSLYIFKEGDPKAKINPWPSSVTIDGIAGDFKTVYFDKRYDLILVPKADTFEDGTRYLVIVTKQMLDQQDKAIDESIAFTLLKSKKPLMENFKINKHLAILEEMSLREVIPIELARTNLLPLIEKAKTLVPRKNMALTFVFTTPQVNQEIADLRESLTNQMFGKTSSIYEAANTPIVLSYLNLGKNPSIGLTTVYQANLSELGNLSDQENLSDLKDFGLSDFYSEISTNSNTNFLPLFTTPIDFNGDDKADNLTLTRPLQSAKEIHIDKIYRGHFPCMNFLSTAPSEIKIEMDNNNDNYDTKTSISENTYNASSNTTNNDNANSNANISYNIENWSLDLPNRSFSPGNDCPKVDSATNPTALSVENSLDFWLSVPRTSNNNDTNNINEPHIVIYQHGLGGDSNEFIAIANRMAEKGIAVIAIDAFAHGARNTDTSGNALMSFFNFQNPEQTADYMIQTAMDLSRLTVLLKTNPIILSLLGLQQSAKTTINSLFPDSFIPNSDLKSDTKLVFKSDLKNDNSNDDYMDLRSTTVTTILREVMPKVHFVGLSLGGILGVLLKSYPVPINRMILNGAGGDIADIVLNSPLLGKQMIIPALSSSLNLEIGSPELYSALVAMEILIENAMFSKEADPLAVADLDQSINFLQQQIIDDSTVPNDNGQLLTQSFATMVIIGNDGDQDLETVSNQDYKWNFYPESYSSVMGGTGAGIRAGHTFLIDNSTTATCASQLQLRQFLLDGTVLDPTGEIIQAECD